jgi:hypothetical protein
MPYMKATIYTPAKIPRLMEVRITILLVLFLHMFLHETEKIIIRLFFKHYAFIDLETTRFLTFITGYIEITMVIIKTVRTWLINTGGARPKKK